jgi:hypothetical protein
MPFSLLLWLFVLFTRQAGVSNLAATGAIGMLGRIRPKYNHQCRLIDLSLTCRSGVAANILIEIEVTTAW